MPIADDDYRKRLAASRMSQRKAAREAAFARPNTLPESYTAQEGIIPVPQFVMDWQKGVAEMQTRNAYANPQLDAANRFADSAVMGSVGGGPLPSFGRSGAALLSRLPRGLVSRAIDDARKIAEMEAKNSLGEAAHHGADFALGKERQFIDAASGSGEEALFRLFDEFDRLGMGRKAATEFLDSFPRSIEAVGLRESLPASVRGGVRLSSRERLAERLLEGIRNATDDAWWNIRQGGQ